MRKIKSSGSWGLGTPTPKVKIKREGEEEKEDEMFWKSKINWPNFESYFSL